MPEAMRENDAELLLRYRQNGDAGAFEELVDRHGSMVYNVCRRILGRNDLAEDAAQATFLLLSYRIGRVKGEHVAGWLYRSASFLSRQALREERRRTERERRAAEQIRSSRDDDAVWLFLRPELDRAIEQLPVASREAVVLHCLEGRAYQDLAAELGITESAARQRISRALKQLRHQLGRLAGVLTALSLGGLLQARACEAAPAHVLAACKAAALGMSPASAEALAILEKGVNVMFWKTMQTAVAAVILATCLSIGAVYAGKKMSEKGTPPVAAEEQPAPPKEESKVNQTTVTSDKTSVKPSDEKTDLTIPKGEAALNKRRLELDHKINALRSKLGLIEKNYFSDPEVAKALEMSTAASKEQSEAFKRFMAKLEQDPKWQKIQARRKNRDERNPDFMKATRESNEYYEKFKQEEKEYAAAEAKFKKAYAYYQKVLRSKASQDPEYVRLRQELEQLKPEYIAVCRKLKTFDKEEAYDLIAAW